jgi:uncharacterized peroxidase-related enzyme
LVQAIKTDYHTANLDARTRAMLEYVEKATRTPDEMTPADLDVLREHRFSDEDILDMTHIMGYFNYINRVADALGFDPEPDYEPIEKTTPKRAALLKTFFAKKGTGIKFTL